MGASAALAVGVSRLRAKAPKRKIISRVDGPEYFRSRASRFITRRLGPTDLTLRADYQDRRRSTHQDRGQPGPSRSMPRRHHRGHAGLAFSRSTIPIDFDAPRTQMAGQSPGPPPMSRSIDRAEGRKAVVRGTDDPQHTRAEPSGPRQCSFCAGPNPASATSFTRRSTTLPATTGVAVRSTATRRPHGIPRFDRARRLSSASIATSSLPTVPSCLRTSAASLRRSPSSMTTITSKPMSRLYAIESRSATLTGSNADRRARLRPSGHRSVAERRGASASALDRRHRAALITTWPNEHSVPSSPFSGLRSSTI